METGNTGMLIWLLCIWGSGLAICLCALLYSRKPKPMHFGSGVQVPSARCRDIAGYNRANRNMWLLYSLPYWLGGLLFFRWRWLAIGMVTLAGTLGILVMIWAYGKIAKKYLI